MKNTIHMLITAMVLVLFSGCTTIQHNGYEYGTVTSPYTGRIWLDRNIGASRACQSFYDKKCYGDYFQWGRDADGHEKKNSDITSKQTKSITNAGSEFIKATGDNKGDWAHKVDPQGIKRQAKWQSTDGSSVCPRGFRLPTIEELEAETTEGGVVSNTDTAFQSFLKLSSAGSRYYDEGSLEHKGSGGGIWSSSVIGPYSHGLGFYRFGATSDYDTRASGASVRCLKN